MKNADRALILLLAVTFCLTVLKAVELESNFRYRAELVRAAKGLVTQ